MTYSSYLNAALPLFLFAAGSFLLGVILKKNIFHRAGLTLYITGIIFNMLSVAARWQAAGYAPMSNTYETLVFMALCVAIMYLFFRKADKSGILAFGASILVLIILAVSSFFTADPKPLMPVLKSNWLITHVSFCFFSYAAFAMSFISSIIYLVSKKDAAIDFDSVSYKSVLFGFPFLTLGIVTGAVWAEQAWGTYWSWDPKETWALITWLIYLIYLHTRYFAGWKGAKSAWVAVAGFALVLFTYFGVNYLLTGLHSYGK